MDEELKQELRASTGFRVLRETDAQENVDVYKDYKSARQERYNDMVENDKFYHGVHYDEAEEAEIIARGQAPLPINATYSLIKQMISLLTGSDPIWYVDPVADTDKKYAYMMRHLLNASWYNSRGSRQFSQIAKETAVVGVGYGMVQPVYNDFFYVGMTQIPYHQVFVSPSTREFDYSDSENIIISKSLSYQQLADFFGKTTKWVEEHASSETADAGDDEEDIRYVRYQSPQEKLQRAQLIQRLTKESADIFIVTPIGTSNLQQRVYFELTDSIRRKQKQGLVSIQEVKGKRVLAKYISLGDYCEKYYLPITSYNIVPFIDEFNGNPYPLGEVDYLYGIQRALDKFILLAILNATLSNNMKVMAVKGSIDKDYFSESYAIPGALVEYDWREGMPAPQQINPVPLSAEFYAFPKTLIGLMEYITGIFGVVQGNPEGAPRTASGLMSLQNYGGQKVKLLARNMQDALSALGDVAIQLWQNYAPYNGRVQYFEENREEPTDISYNTLRAEGGKIMVDNNISVGKFRTRVKVVQNYGTERDLKANLLANLAAQTKSQALIKPILKLADIPEADEIIREIDQVAQANQTIQQLQQQLQRLQQVNTQMENELLRQGRKMQIDEFRGRLDKVANKAEAETKIGVSSAIQQAEMASEPTEIEGGFTE